jgi:hypothetical protein
MTEPLISDPKIENKAIETAIEHVRTAERELDRAHEDESRAEHELEEAIEELDEHAEHAQNFWVIVNGRRKEVHRHRLTFEEVVALAFLAVPPGDNIIYAVAYRNGGDPKHPEGSPVAGASVKVKDGTIFDVPATDKS